MQNLYHSTILILFLMMSCSDSDDIKDDGLNKGQDGEQSAEQASYFELMDQLKDEVSDPLLKTHFQSMRDVVEVQGQLSVTENLWISETLKAFDEKVDGDASDPNSYYERKRPVVISWVSPTDDVVSYTRMLLPKDYDPDKSYPLYVDLHGLWNVADNPIDFMTFSFRQGASYSFAFEDGFVISMWGRGNHWYQGISEIDIDEGVETIEALLNIDQNRKYIVGHSMGGYGAWYLSSKSLEKWAAVGVHAGALVYGNGHLLTDQHVNALSDMPMYFVCGTNDFLLPSNKEAHRRLTDAGNLNTELVTFNGGHEYVHENVEKMYLWIREYKKE